MFLEDTYFQKGHVFERNLFPKGTCFQVGCVTIRYVFPEETYFWKEHVSGRLVLVRTPLGDSYFYMCPKVIQEAYLMSVLSRRTWDAEAFRKTCLTGEYP